MKRSDSTLIVIFVSCSEKQAIKPTRMILDLYAERVGNNTWRTAITEKGLETVRSKLLVRATKNMAVACHIIRKNNRITIAWIVGNRDRFNIDGSVAVNYTSKNINHREWESNFMVLNQIKELSSLAGVLHDWGKSNDFFQEKLVNRENLTAGDPLRHEWISCKLLNSLVNISGNNVDDFAWLSLLKNNVFTEKELLHNLQTSKRDAGFTRMPPIATAICWLILSHHRMPAILDKNKRNGYAMTIEKDINEMLQLITPDWWYSHEGDTEKCFTFSNGILTDSCLWTARVKKIIEKIENDKENLLKAIAGKELRSVLLYSRTCLMLADYCISSQDKDSTWKTTNKLIANTGSDKAVKQKLDEHVIKVSKKATEIAQFLPKFKNEMYSAHDIHSLNKKSPKKFSWQNKDIAKINKYKEKHDCENAHYFAVVMASTGCGKTYFNPKLMQAISSDGDSLRYILAVGLRSLTLQTGDDYVEGMKIPKEDVGILIGSAATRELYEEEKNINNTGSESEEAIFTDTIEAIESVAPDFLNVIFGRNVEKSKALLYKPVIVATIDHIMPAVETIKGGRYILPFLRLMSSDLVIDEIDDFDKTDSTAISRLVYTAGLLGRNVVISSATIPPDLAEGYYRTYQEGLFVYNKTVAENVPATCIWCDEFKAQITEINKKNGDTCSSYFAKRHEAFINARIKRLNAQLIKRKGYIVNCDDILNLDIEDRELAYFETIRRETQCLHLNNSFIDIPSGKNVSFGMVRMANIKQCVKLWQYLMSTDTFSADFAPKILLYHSRQVLLERHDEEAYLDIALKRKNLDKNNIPILDEPIIRRHIDNCLAQNVIFILIATPVEEVGRDHDFDWSIIEPSSYRSFIQLVGRILRHRDLIEDIQHPNTAIMEYNIRGLYPNTDLAFLRPGYETCRRYKLNNKSVNSIVDVSQIENKIDAVPRIQKPKVLKQHESLVDLEHYVMQDFKDIRRLGPAGMHGFLLEDYWMTGLPQLFNPFRESSPQINLYLLYRDGHYGVYEKAEDNITFIRVNNLYDIDLNPDPAAASYKQERFWLERDYDKTLDKWAELKHMSKERVSERYGEFSIIKTINHKSYYYSDQTGVYEKPIEDE